MDASRHGPRLGDLAQCRAMKVILTGATGMVGEGVLLGCLESPEVEHVLSVSRRPGGRDRS